MDSSINSNQKQKYPNKINTKSLFDNIKSIYIYKGIFDNLHRRTLLKIIKYNKNEKKRLSINNKDYKSFSEIEIEIIPAHNIYGKLINISKKGEEIYYHIYFNNIDKEIKKNYFDETDKVSKIKIIIEYKINSLSKLFNYCKYIETVYIKNFYLDNINNMSGMFFGCSNLQKVYFSYFNAEKVKDISYMFYGCSKLKELNLSTFRTNEITTMAHMFYECSSLEEINLSNLKINNIKNMSQMFSWCTSLEKISFPNFKIKKKNVDMRWMFNGCQKELRLKIEAQNKIIKNEAFV